MVKPIKKLVKSFVSQAANIIFPPRCVNCYCFTMQHGALCIDCWSKLNFISNPYCNSCGIPFEFVVGDSLTCGDCITKNPSFDQARSAVVYDESCTKLITSFKYGDKTHHARILSKWIDLCGKDILNKTDFMIPVPIHLKRLRKRKYNQAALLAKYLQKDCKIPILYDGLIRVKNTPQQAGLSSYARMRNLSGAILFNQKYKHQLQGKTVTIIDDVMTTGSTLEVCSRVLKKAGIKKIYALTVARTIKEVT